MEEITAGVMAVPEAPPGDDTAVAVAAEAPPPPTETASAPDNPGAMPDPSDADAMATWLDASEAFINARAAQDTPEPTPEPPATTAPEPAAAAPSSASEPPPPPPTPDYAAIAADLAAKGYKVEAPAPPPDPYQQLVADLVSERGTDEEYAQVRHAATVRLPAEPAAYDADSVSAHEAAVAARNAASDRLDRMDQARRITDRAIRFGRERSLGEIGAAFNAMPETYQLTPERAGRVVNPQSASDAVAAIVEQVTDRLNASWQAKLAAEAKIWEGKVAQARSDRSAAAVQRMGRAPQATSTPGGQPAPGAPIWAVDQHGLPTEESIQRAIRGDFERVSLG